MLALAMIGTMLALPGAGSASPAAPAAGGRPDIVLVLTDDQRWDTLEAMPSVSAMLAAPGVTFRNAFAVNPTCCPSRASILTGRWSHTHGVYANSGPHGGYRAFDDRTTVATTLQDAGYRTALIGKYLNGYGAAAAIPPGWDRWFAFLHHPGYYDYRVSDQGVSRRYGSSAADYSTDVLAAEAGHFVRSTPSSQPLFLIVSPFAPHKPAEPAPRHAGSLDGLAPHRPPSYDEAEHWDKPAYVQSQEVFSETKRRDLDDYRQRQLESLLAVDDLVAGLVQALTEAGRLHETLFVFASDNGYSWGEHRWATKLVPYEESIRVPLVVRYDALTTPHTEDAIALNVDLAPTFAAGAGVDLPGSEGASLLPLLGDGAHRAEGWREEFLFENLASEGVPSYCAVRTENDVYIRYGTGEEELYELSADPWQLDNLAREAGPAALEAHRGSLRELCRPAPPGYRIDTVPPVVTITSGPPPTTSESSAGFEFGADVTSEYGCSVDGARLQRCTSPFAVEGLQPGRHVFALSARTPDGLIGHDLWGWTVADPAPARTIGGPVAPLGPEGRGAA